MSGLVTKGETSADLNPGEKNLDSLTAGMLVSLLVSACVYACSMKRGQPS